MGVIYRFICGTPFACLTYHLTNVYEFRIPIKVHSEFKLITLKFTFIIKQAFKINEHISVSHNFH